MKALQPKGGVPIVTRVPKQGPIARARKSRDGCRRCKQRRRKCGEEKPECRRCVDDRVLCPGYTKDFRWSSKYEVLKGFDAPAAPSMTSQTFAPQSEMHSTVTPASEGAHAQVTGSSINLQTPDFGLQDSSAQCPIPTPVTVLQQDYSVSDPPLDHHSNVSGWSDFETPFAASEQAFDPLSSGLTPEFDGSTSAFPDPTEDHFSARPHLSNFEACLQSPQEQDVEEVVCQSDTSLMPAARYHRSTSSNSRQGPNNLLKWYYRMSPLQYSDSDLVEHYFSQVCRLYALFDSTKNPFRALVGSNWDSSGSIMLAIQSMSCAHLANSDSAMVRIGQSKQRQAKISIQNDLQLWKAGNISADRLLLAILLLGPTVSWHNPSDLGLDYLNIARELINAKLAQADLFTDSNTKALEHFFMHAMIYWEMMISFVDSRDDGIEPDPALLGPSLQQLSADSTAGSTPWRDTIKPHPWTGIAPHIQMLFAEVGRIIRRHVTSADAPLTTESEVKWAMAIEKALSDAIIPTGDNVLDSEDHNTPGDHFVELAEAYRCAALLQIYHIFPTVLAGRLTATMGRSGEVSSDDGAQYRVDLALHTLRLVEALPLSSGTSCLHPILVLTAGSELKYRLVPTGPLSEDFAANQSIAAGRDIAEKRLSDLARRLPQQPFLRMLDIMKETWLQMDLFNVEVHWMEVMYLKGWETIMG